jgi:hypothetical protein
MRENREIPRTARHPWCVTGRVGKANAVADDERWREVGQPRSTNEVAERKLGPEGHQAKDGPKRARRRKRRIQPREVLKS